MRTFGRAGGFSGWAHFASSTTQRVSLVADRLEIKAALADRHDVANALDQDRADRTDMRGLVRDREVRVAEFAALRIDDDVGRHAAPGERENGFAVDITARSHAEFALDAAIEIDQHIRMRGVDWSMRVELDKMRRHHLAVVGKRLQLAVAALFASRAEVVALDEQHLNERPAVGV